MLPSILLMTSSFKMDGVFLRSADFGPISEIIDALDPEIGIVLEQLHERSRRDIESELVRDFDLKVLLETRTTIFRMAMDKVDCCLSEVAKAQAIATFVPNLKETKLIVKANKLFRSITPRDMVNRKSAKKAVTDIIELIAYVCREKAKFPVAVMRTKAKGARHKSQGGIGSDDIECLQRISELMSADETQPDIMIRSEYSDSELQSYDSDSESLPEDTKAVLGGPTVNIRALGDDRIPSRMYGYGGTVPEDMSKQKVGTRSHSMCGKDMSHEELRDHLEDVIVHDTGDVDNQVENYEGDSIWDSNVTIANSSAVDLYALNATPGSAEHSTPKRSQTRDGATLIKPNAPTSDHADEPMSAPDASFNVIKRVTVASREKNGICDLSDGQCIPAHSVPQQSPPRVDPTLVAPNAPNSAYVNESESTSKTMSNGMNRVPADIHSEVHKSAYERPLNESKSHRCGDSLSVGERPISATHDYKSCPPVSLEVTVGEKTIRSDQLHRNPSAREVRSREQPLMCKVVVIATTASVITLCDRG